MRIRSAIAAVVLHACAQSPLPASAVCEETSEREAGLTCLPYAVFENMVCREVGTVCTTTCNVDADCSPLGATFMCFATCDGKACGDTASP